MVQLYLIALQVWFGTKRSQPTIGFRLQRRKPTTSRQFQTQQWPQSFQVVLKMEANTFSWQPATENWPMQPWSKNRKASGCQKMILQEWLRNMETCMHTTQHGMSDISWWTYETNYKTFWVSETDHWDAVQECWRQLENLHASNSQSFHTPISMECWISTKGLMKQITKPCGCQRLLVGVQWKMKSFGHLQHETAFRVQSKLVWVAVVATYETARCGVSETDCWDAV